MYSSDKERYEQFNKDFIYVLLVVSLAVLVSGFIAYLSLKPKEVRAIVSGYTWSRTYHIDRYTWTRERSTSGFPDGSRNHSTNWEVISTYMTSSRDYAGQDCTSRKSGTTYTQTCTPKYETHYQTHQVWGTAYYYEIREWHHWRDASLEIGGTMTRAASWPNAMLLGGDEPERIASQEEHYSIVFADAHDPKKTWHQDVSYKDWMENDPAKPYIITVNFLGDVESIKPTQPE